MQKFESFEEFVKSNRSGAYVSVAEEASVIAKMISEAYEKAYDSHTDDEVRIPAHRVSLLLEFIERLFDQEFERTPKEFLDDVEASKIESFWHKVKEAYGFQDSEGNDGNDNDWEDPDW